MSTIDALQDSFGNPSLDEACEIIAALIKAIKQRPEGPSGWLTPDEEDGIMRGEKFLRNEHFQNSDYQP